MADDLETDAALATLTKEELAELAEEIDPDVREMRDLKVFWAVWSFALWCWCAGDCSLTSRCGKVALLLSQIQ